ncbi:MAG: hypothetical protein BGO55_23045 [Sphingobacteriales bacterium 50-39]|nr:RNA polymerase sigma-70 factor [Sphingobacteriales bacterium]OJW58187.1 MAG: hypothetical protein BGO55_23045 [Sphingobacteriales bacterium 50-39]
MLEEEAIILDKIRRRDEKAFERLYKEYHEDFFLVACQYLHDPSVAREAVNDVFMTLWERAESLHIEISLKRYLHRAVINHCINILHKRKREAVRREELPEMPSVVEQDNTLEENELNLQLYRAINELPEQCRKVFKLSRFESKKKREIADQMGLSVKTVKNHINHALKRLHRVLVERGVIRLLILCGIFFDLIGSLAGLCCLIIMRYVIF